MSNRQTFITALALFSLFFGAGNLILPPQLGFKSGELWWLVTLGFCISAVIIPIAGILAHARLQGTMFHFANKISPTFSVTYCFVVYLISVGLPSPRTASVTHEMAIAPLFGTSPLLTSILYFLLVFVFVMNRSKILDIIGKFLTPAILFILMLIISITLITFDFAFGEINFPYPFTHGILEGYQTFDAIGGVVVGGVIIVSINLKLGNASYAHKRKLITKAGILAGAGLLLVYGGLILNGALMHDRFDLGISRTELLSGISIATLGNTTNFFLSALIALACFTTAVGIVTGAADFAKSRFSDSQKAYTITAVIGCVLGIVMGQFNVGYIIAVAVPALMFIYPITIALILLNVIPDKWSSPSIFKAVILTTVLFSIPDFVASLGFGEAMKPISEWLPLGNYNLAWVLPAVLVFVIANLTELQLAKN